MNPFALDGASFLWLYGGLIVLTLLVLFLWRPDESGQPVVHATQLKPEHWAVLSAGPQRAAEVMFMRLLLDDIIYWNDGDSRYEPRDPHATHPVCLALKRGESVQAILKTLEAEAKAPHADLIRWGLIRSEAARQQFISRARWMLVGLFFLGVGRAAQAFVKDRPFGYLLMMMLGVILIWVLTRNPSLTTKSGRTLLSQYARDMDHIRRAPPREDLVTAVALGGFLVLNGTDFGHALGAAHPERYNRVADDSGTYTYLDSGSGSGDSGSDGSGCGGCGGGD